MYRTSRFAGLSGKCLAVAVALCGASANAAEPGVPDFKIRPGYKVTLAAENFGQPARFMELGPDGTLYVSEPQAGTVMALRDKDGDGVYETKSAFLTGYPDAHSMVWDGDALYVTSAADGSCKKCRSTKNDGVADDVSYFLPPGSVPSGGGHPVRGIVFTKDHVFVSVSDPQNMTDTLPSDRKSVYRFDRDGSNKMQFATGIRNTEKLRLRPGTEELWGMDHGTDNFGGTYGESRGNQPITDVLPGEELNHLEEGKFYGHPFISNNRIVRPEYAGRKDIVQLAAKTTPPALVFGAHWAPNGFSFLNTDKLTGHRGDMVVAFHGSWNSSLRVGYCIEHVLFDDMTGQPIGHRTLVSTLAADGRRPLARPVDCVECPDGSVLFSCDTTNKIYRLSKAE